MGLYGTGGGGGAPAPAAATDLSFYMGYPTTYSWTPGGSPNSYTVYVEQSSDQSSWTAYTSQEAYTNSAEIYLSDSDYWYRFYVASHYPGSIRVDSGYSSEQYYYGAPP